MSRDGDRHSHGGGQRFESVSAYHSNQIPTPPVEKRAAFRFGVLSGSKSSLVGIGWEVKRYLNRARPGRMHSADPAFRYVIPADRSARLRSVIDPLVSLALSVHETKGVYALLLGSGVSRPSGIPTGWEIVLDLISKVAHLQGEQPTDLVRWYVDRYGREPDYAVLLEELCPTATERNLLLRRYFEPTDDEREQGLKLATVAHRAIAQLVRDGYVRVIVTTNFDRLMEQAIESTGITPSVISTADHIQGALPLTHSRVTIVKLHGDYLDARFRNTTAELAGYEPAMDALLDRICDDYGMIIVGWSATWDAALRAALERTANRRFTTYFCARDTLSTQAQDMVQRRGFRVITISDANSFCVSLVERLSALDAEASHPLSLPLAIATIKRLLPNPHQRIRLSDLVLGEAKQLADRARQSRDDARTGLSDEDIRSTVARYNTWLSPLRELLALGAYWRDDEHQVWQQALRIVAESTLHPTTTSDRIKLVRYLPLHLWYAVGIACVARGQFASMRSIMEILVSTGLREREHLLLEITSSDVLRRDLAQALHHRQSEFHTPLNDYLFVVLRDAVKEVCPTDADYEATFDRFEYLYCLIVIDLQLARDDRYLILAGGRYYWQRSRESGRSQIENQIETELTSQKEQWLLLQSGLFGGSIERAEAAHQKTQEELRSRRQHMI
jgi:phosphoserine phosphatase